MKFTLLHYKTTPLLTNLTPNFENLTFGALLDYSPSIAYFNSLRYNSVNLIRKRCNILGISPPKNKRNGFKNSLVCLCFYEEKNWLNSVDDKEWHSLLFGNADDNNDQNPSVVDSNVSISEEDKQLTVLVENLEKTNKNMNWRKFSRIIRSFPYRMTQHRAIKLIKMLGERASWQIAVNVIHWLEDRQGKEIRADKHIYTTLISTLGEKYPNSVMEIFHIMIKKGETYPDMPCYHAVSVALGRAGYLDELLQVMDTLRKGVDKRLPEFRFSLKSECFLLPDNIVYNSILNACVSKKEWKAIDWVFQSMKADQLTPDSATYGLAIEVMTRCGKTNEAFSLFQIMTKKNLLPNSKTYKYLITLLGETNQLSEAEECMEEMKETGVVMDASVYYSLANAYCKNGRWKDAINLVDKMSSFPDSQSTVITYTNFIRTCFNFGWKEEAMAVFHHMINIKCLPNMSTYNLMLRIYGSESSTYAEAKRVYEEMGRGRMFGFAYEGVPGGTFRISPDDDTYACMLHACARCRQWEDFESVFWSSVRGGCHLSDADCVYFLQQSLKDGKTQISRLLMEKMEMKYLDEKINYEMRNEEKEKEKDKEIEKEKEDSRLSLLHEAKLVHSANSKKMESVLQLLDLMIEKNQSLETSTLLHVISSFRESMTVEVSRKLLNRIARMACLPDRRVYLELIRALLCKQDAKNVLNALVAAQKMQRMGFEIDIGTYSSLIRCCFRACLWKDCIELYESGRKKGYEFSGVVMALVTKSKEVQGERGSDGCRETRVGSHGNFEKERWGEELGSGSSGSSESSESSRSGLDSEEELLPSPFAILNEWKTKKSNYKSSRC